MLANERLHIGAVDAFSGVVLAENGTPQTQALDHLLQADKPMFVVSGVIGKRKACIE